LPVDAGKLFLETVQVVLLPVVLGVVLNRKAPRLARPVAAISPSISVLLILLVVGAIVAKNKDSIAGSAGQLALAVVLLHGGGFALGYLLSRLLGHPEPVRRTLAIEVGMQNSGLGAGLARHLPDPLAPVPSALSAVCHCLIGSLLAAIWRRRG
jgi:BASS family bile acid:Na+ symporter